ncbi:hypothetical protein B296_00023146 [Ensete ventricosum]|uniref:Uncharacterized protein n=1 Tax=Ensete ventricosum TaxID=4639 RepID=A0A426Z994_ENSVE|nr:hypothetical protein B296_00023146 [Ensete ventricosum]
MRELCEVEDRAWADMYFASVVTRLKCIDSEDPLGPRWSAISGSSQFQIEGPLFEEYPWGALHPTMAKARNDRARLEGDVLSLIEATTFLEAELKVEGSKVMAAYKASRGFESGLEKMGRVSYEFGYRVTLKRLRGKYPELMIEQDPFVECPNNAKVEIDVNHPFDDSTSPEK